MSTGEEETSNNMLNIVTTIGTWAGAVPLCAGHHHNNAFPALHNGHTANIQPKHNKKTKKTKIIATKKYTLELSLSHRHDFSFLNSHNPLNPHTHTHKSACMVLTLRCLWSRRLGARDVHVLTCSQMGINNRWHCLNAPATRVKCTRMAVCDSWMTESSCSVLFCSVLFCHFCVFSG